MKAVTLLVAVGLVLLWPEPAQAFFLVPFVATALAVSTLTATIIVGVASVALSVGISWAANKLLAKGEQPAEAAEAGGVELDLRADADVPQSLIVGRAVTAGSLVYAETYGKRGEIDNSDLIQIIALADHPVTGIPHTYCESQLVELTQLSGGEGVVGVGAANRGLGVAAGYDFKIAFAHHLGTQTSADALALAALGAHPERPWTAAMVGRGRAYVRVHTVYDREKMTGPVACRFVVDGIALYDPRKDTTAGGSGTHRFGDLATHEFSRNLAVITYNILRGIRVADHTGALRHFYGLENTPAANLPLDNWFAAMNEADVLVDDEPQFHGGAEISLSTEPLAAITQLLKATGGRLSERGGVYKLHLGAPGLPAVSISDGALRADEGDEYRPILTLDSRVNYVTAKYTSPEDGWIPKPAPVRRDAAMEAEDGRRLEADLDVPMVQSAAHVQRLMQQLLRRARQQRRHTIPLPPAAYGLEPGDVLEWTSARNGYVDKLFEVDAVEDYSNLNSTVALIEIDPADYDWDGETDYVEQPVGSLVTNRPAPKVIEGFDAEGTIHEGANGVVRAAIRVTWDVPEDGDVEAVEVQVRRSALIADPATFGTDEPAAAQMIILAALTPATAYQVRGRFLSFNGYATEWSLWIDVVTPDVRIIQAELSRQLDAIVRQVNQQLAPFLALVREELGQLATALNGQSAGVIEREGRILMGVGASAGSAAAQVEQALIAIANAEQALAAFIQTVEADYATNTALSEAITTAVATANAALVTFQQSLLATGASGSALGRFRISTGVLPSGAVASIALEVNVSTTATPSWQPAGIYLDAMSGFARIRLVANLIALSHPSVNGGNPFDMLAISNIGGTNVAVLNGLLYVQKLVANAVQAGHVAAGAINAGSILVQDILVTGHLVADAATALSTVNLGNVGITPLANIINVITATALIGRVVIICSFTLKGVYSANVPIDLKIDGATVTTWTAAVPITWDAPNSRFIQGDTGPTITFVHVGTVSAGSHLYSLEVASSLIPAVGGPGLHNLNMTILESRR